MGPPRPPNKEGGQPKADANVDGWFSVPVWVSKAFDVNSKPCLGVHLSFENDKVVKPMPRKVMEELLASFFLSATAFMDFRLSSNHIATCSDASETGGGLCQSVGLTPFGSQAAESLVRGEFPEVQGSFGDQRWWGCRILKGCTR